MDVILTFDDGLDTHYSRVGPLLKSHGFNASFFVTPKNVWQAFTDEIRPLTREELLSLYEDGFDIGNHTYSHINMKTSDKQVIVQEVQKLDSWLAEMGVPKPVTFSYPTFRSSPRSAQILRDLGFVAARTGFADEPQKLWHGVPALRPKKYYKAGDDPLRVYTTAVLNNNYSLDWFKKDLDEAPEGSVMVVSGHGVNQDSVWNLLQDMVKYLSDNGGRFVSLRHIEREFNASHASGNSDSVTMLGFGGLRQP